MPAQATASPAQAPANSLTTTALRLTAYEQAVNFVRAHGPMTAAKLADRLQWPEARVRYAIGRARELALLTRTGKTQSGKFIYGAVQVPGWPLPAPDTVRL